MDISERLAKAGITGDAAIYDDSDPEHLMRSRYCAFVMQDADYLIKTRIHLVERRRYVPN